MAKRQPGRGGRPSKGPRDLMVTRLQTHVAEQVRALADDRDWSYSETLAALVAISLDHLADLPGAPAEQEELPLTKAS